MKKFVRNRKNGVSAVEIVVLNCRSDGDKLCKRAMFESEKVS